MFSDTTQSTWIFRDTSRISTGTGNATYQPGDFQERIRFLTPVSSESTQSTWIFRGTSQISTGTGAATYQPGDFREPIRF